MGILNKIWSKLNWMGFLEWIPDELFLRIAYRLRFERSLNLSEPKTFNEKLQWLKLYDRRPEYSEMVDKYEAKRYVAERIGEQYIIPTLGIWESFDDIDFSQLPDQFVLKTTHDSGGVVICTDKVKLDISAARKKLEKSLKRDYFKRSHEWPYKNVKHCIIAEQFISDDSGEQEVGREELADYKIWCFGGKPHYIQYITGRNSGSCKEGFYDTDWKLQSFSYHNELTDQVKQKPGRLAELLQLAEQLAKGMPFVRVDFYVLKDSSIRFGEITFYPMSGMQKWSPEEMDSVMGEKLEIHGNDR